MANKNDNYYMINGDQIESYAIHFPYKGTYYKNVRDISDMDLATLEQRENLRDVLQEINPTIELGNQLYIGKYPYSKGIKIFKPIEIFKSSDRIDNIVDKFIYIAEHRNYLYHSNKKLEFSDKEKEKLVELAYAMIDDMTFKQKDSVFSASSIVGYKVKHGRLNNKHEFERQLGNYTQLRNLLINYLTIKANRSLPTNFQLNMISTHLENIKALYKEKPEEIEKALKEYKEAILKIKDEQELKRAAEKLTQDPNKQYEQMTLFDLFPCEETKTLTKTNKTRLNV